MTEIPEDVMKRANLAIEEGVNARLTNMEIIARAILAERERCARIADTVLLWKGMPGDFEANQVAAAIRANVTFPLA